MSSLLLPRRFYSQPQGAVEIAAEFAQYTVAAFTGPMAIAGIDALGQPLIRSGAADIIVPGCGEYGVTLRKSSGSNALLYYANKNVGVIGSADFTLTLVMSMTGGAEFPVFCGKGDTGAAEWMFGTSEANSQIRFYGATAAALTTTSITNLGNPMASFNTYSVTRANGVLSLILNAIEFATDTSASSTFTDTTHHLSFFGGDYDGTTYDNTRDSYGQIESFSLQVGIGGVDYAKGVARNPWQIFRVSE